MVNYASKEAKFEVSDSVEFADNRVIVVIDNKTSLKLKKYSNDDFRIVGCKQVKELSKNVDNKIRCVIENISQHVSKGSELEEYNGIKLGDYHQILCLELTNSGRDNVIEAVRKINTMDGVLVACPDYKLTLMSVPDDPYLGNQQAGTVDYLDLIDLYDAWDITTGSKSVRVGVIDSGIDTTHLDLSVNLDINLSKNYSTGAEEDGSLDSTGHGTAVAGVIGAKGDNSVGISGVCWDVELVSLKVIDHNENGFASSAMNAIDYAASDQADIDILNMSVGWYGDETTPPIYYDVPFNASISNFDGLVVCAAGNANTDLNTRNLYPAVYDCSNIITVGASTRNDTKYSTSNYSTTYVDLFAPGDCILTTFAGNVCGDPNRHQYVQLDHYADGYHRMYETSIATPFVTGVAALMLSVNPNLTATQLKDIIIRSVDVVPALENYCVSGGRLNAYKAVNTAKMMAMGYNTEYIVLTSGDSAISHGVYYDICSECSCRNTDGSCDECGICDPCDSCHTYYTELHDFNVISSTSLVHHTVYCEYCGYSYNESHDWYWDRIAYTCSICLKQTDSYPGIMSLPDPELEAYLASLSKEELDLFLASLPEEELSRITALLPPENEDEYLTE